MTKKNTLVTFSLGLPLVLSMAATVLAQSTGGTIRGTVLDPSGALVPRAQIIITNTTGLSRKLKTSATGSFEVPHLAPGTYSLSINASGFTPALEGDVQVSGDKITEESIKLGISVTQEINVSAEEIEVAK